MALGKLAWDARSGWKRTLDAADDQIETGQMAWDARSGWKPILEEVSEFVHK